MDCEKNPIAEAYENLCTESLEQLQGDELEDENECERYMYTYHKSWIILPPQNTLSMYYLLALVVVVVVVTCEGATW